VNDQCRKNRTCFHCGAINGLVRKVGTNALKISHDKFKAFNTSTSKNKVPPPSKEHFDKSFESVKKNNPEVEKHFKKALDDLNPLRVLKLFKRIADADCELLGLVDTRPEIFLWRQVPAPPVCIRPSVGQDAASTEDDLTAKLGDIVSANANLKEALNKGAPVQSIIEHWDYLSLQIAMYINSDVPGLQKGEYGKQIRGFVQRLKGKQGRFRGNLSGKRVDYSGRTVISPDPNLNIDQVAIPVLVAKNMTYPETVSRYNKAKLQQRVRNGWDKWPGANYIIKAGGGFQIMLKFANRGLIAEQLMEGDTVERHLEDGDIVLFNRQPSLHKLSILSHFVKVRPHRTFRLNECVCNPYNADFDGDEMNLHVPQTEEARTEAVQLMGVKHNIVTPKNGEPIISAIQDFVTAAYLLSSLDNFYDRKTFITTCLGMLEQETTFDLPPPSIIKPQALWTGKQVFNVLMRPNFKSDVRINIDAQCRDFKNAHHNDLKDPSEWLHRDLQDDGFLCIKNSEIMCGRMDKATVGAGKKNSLFYVLYRDFGPNAAAQGMNRLSKLCARWLSLQGFSVGINDVTPTPRLTRMKAETVLAAFQVCDQSADDLKDGKLRREPGLDEKGTLEGKEIKALNDVRTKLSTFLAGELSIRNSPMVMATSGSKGSTVNVAQMVVTLGQQDIEGKRIANGFQDRTLPHFPKHGRSPQSKGFVSNSFFSGLNPSEFVFHAVGGRVGLVDTAVKTAETGYMSRRLMKSLEDLSVGYDEFVRNSALNIVQFRFGGDKLDPVDMEGSAVPVNFERTFAHVESTTFNMADKGLHPDEIKARTVEMLSGRRSKTARRTLLGEQLADDIDLEDARMQQHADLLEGERDFLQTVDDFVRRKADSFAAIREDKANVAIANPLTTPKKAKARTTAQTRKSMANCQPLVQTAASPSTADRFDLTSKISQTTLESFVTSCLEKYRAAQVEPGHAVGAVGAQSIGEPGTQMTLKTFHFAGVAGMSLTQGVPRIKEIINASKDISTPIITCNLVRQGADRSIPEQFGRIVKGRIEALYLEDVVQKIDIVWYKSLAGVLSIQVSLEAISSLALDLTVGDVCRSIKKHRRFKAKDIALHVQGNDRVILHIDEAPDTRKVNASKLEESHVRESFLRLQHLKRLLPAVHVLGHPQAVRAVVTAQDDPNSDEIKEAQAGIAEAAKKEEDGIVDAKVEEDDDIEITGTKIKKPKGRMSKKTKIKQDPEIKEEEGEVSLSEKPLAKLAANAAKSSKPVQMHKVMVEGYGLRYCLNTDGVDPYSTSTNSIIETLQVLGIEAARTKIIKEMQEVTKDLSIDPRHMALLADVMTYKGEVLGITRFGLAKMRDSVLQLASFEKTADHVFDAGSAGKVDPIEGVSECVIVGKTMGVGTGSADVVRNMHWREMDTSIQPTTFEDCWVELHGRR
jgi:DNA-directed RNA polymerase III subunit RPC1